MTTRHTYSVATQLPIRPDLGRHALPTISGAPRWSTDERGVLCATVDIMGVGRANYGRRTISILVRVAQRPDDGAWLVDAAPFSEGAHYRFRATRARETRELAQKAAGYLAQQVLQAIVEETDRAARPMPGCLPPVPSKLSVAR